MQARKELDDLTVTQPAASQELPDYSSTSTRPQRHYAMHVSVGLAALCTWWYYLQDVPALERKLLSVLLSPVRLAYLLGICSQPYSDLSHAACGHCTYSCNAAISNVPGVVIAADQFTSNLVAHYRVRSNMHCTNYCTNHIIF